MLSALGEEQQTILRSNAWQETPGQLWPTARLTTILHVLADQIGKTIDVNHRRSSRSPLRLRTPCLLVTAIIKSFKAPVSRFKQPIMSQPCLIIGTILGSG